MNSQGKEDATQRMTLSKARLRWWSTGGATDLRKFSSTKQGEESKTTLKMKPHRVRKPFQKASGQ